MAGILDFMNTPAGMGLLSAVAGGLAGARRSTPINNVGRGLLSGLEGYSNAQDEILKRQQMEQAQKMQDLQQQQLQGQITDQQSARDFYSPANIAKYSTSATPERTSLAAGPLFGQQALGFTPDFTPQVTPAKPAAFDTTGFAQGMLQSGNPQLAQQGLKTLQQAGPKVKDWKQVNIGGQVLYAPYMEDGTVGKPVPYSVAEKLHFADTGGAIQAADPFTGAPVGAALPKSISPDAKAANSLGWANNSVARKNLAIRQFEADPSGLFGINPNKSTPVSSAIGGNVNGQAFLGTLPKPIGDQVKALAEGRMAFPAGFALKSPYWQNMISMVSQYDPSFDAVNYNARSQTRNDFVKGKSADNITALNTAISHAGTLSDSFDKLGNTSFPAVNAAKNWIGNQFGNQSIQQNTSAVNTEATALAHELAKVFRQTGMSEGEIKDWQSKISASNSPEQMKATLSSAVHLMNGRLNALGARYDQGMGTTSDPYQLLTPKSKETMKKLMNADMPQSAPGNAPSNSVVSLDDYLKSQGH